MKTVLRVFRGLFRLRRRYFGSDFPHYIKDFAKAISYLNVVAVLPSFLAVLLAPDHFFKRIHTTYAGGKSSIHLTPLRFFITSGGLIAALFVYFQPYARWLLNVDLEFDSHDLFILHVATAFMVPFFVTTIIIIVRVALFFINTMPFMGSPITLGYMNIPLYPSTYRRLAVTRFLFSMCYFAPYCWFVTNALPSIVVEEFYLVARFFFSVRSVVPIPVAQFCIFLLVTLTIWRILVYPYVCLLVWSLPAPTAAMLCIDARGLKRSIEEILDRKASKSGGSRREVTFDKAAFGNSVKLIIAEIEALTRTTLRHAAISSTLEPDFFECRENIYLAWSKLLPLSNWVRAAEISEA